MALSDIRHRTGYLFIAVMVGHIILISAQVNSRTGVPILKAVLFGGIAELQRLAWGVQSGIHDVWNGYINLRDVRAQNRTLSTEVADLRVRLQEERALSRTTESLRALLDLRARLALATVAAEVVAGSATPDFRSITINKGRQSGIRLDMAVMAPAGVVGRVVLPGADASTVQLLIDANAAAAALVEKSGAQGIIQAGPNGMLRLDYLASTAVVQPGDLVVTAGTDRVYPKGLIVGTVEQVERVGANRVVSRAPGRGLLEHSDGAGRHRRVGAPGKAPGDAMKAFWVVLAIVVAVLLQTSAAGFMIGHTMPVDLVLVVVIYAALASGRLTGLLGGTLGGLAQDAMSGGILGIGGLAKSVAGFLTGVAGTQFIVTQTFPRFVVFFGATLLHAGIFMGLYVLLGLRHFDRPLAMAVTQGIGNALLGVVAFEIKEFLPGAIERRRARRSSAGRKRFR